MPARMVALRYDDDRLVALPSDVGEAAPPLLIDLDRHRVVARLEGHGDEVFSHAG
jgi:hypothetical protein